MIPFLLVATVAWWMAAPDPVTAGVRTAAGTGARAAGSGVREHWAAGRDGRNLTRTKRRDRWSKGGGFWRNLLRLEHGAVITGKGVKGAAGITRAAVRPVPAAVKAGWDRGRERHRNRAGNRPAGLALDPPWWRREQPQVQPGEQASGTGQEQASGQVGDSPREQVTAIPGIGEVDPDAYTATTRRLPDGSTRGELFYAGAPEEGEQLLATIDRATEDDVRREFADIVAETQRDEAWGTPARIAWVPLDENGRPPSPYGDLEPEPLDAEEQIRARRTDTWNRMFPEPLTESQRRFWTARDGGYGGPLDQDGRPGDPTVWPDVWGDPEPTGETVCEATNSRPRGRRLCEMCGERPWTTRYQDPWRGQIGSSIDAALGRPLRICDQCASEIDADEPDHQPGDGDRQPVKTDPDPADISTDPTATPTSTEGAPMSVNMPSEINDLTTLHSFAQAVIDDAEENGPGSQYAAAAASLSEYFGRDFGREVNATASAFEEAAAALNQAWTAMVEAAAAMKNESLTAIGG